MDKNKPKPFDISLLSRNS